MSALLDVNVLIALLDPQHVSAEATHLWFEKNRTRGWATCPFTVAGCARILGHPGYQDGPGSVAGALWMLEQACSDESHEFWADDFSLLDRRVFRLENILGPRQVTDAYLLALAVRRRGQFVTFDKSIRLETVIGVEPRHLSVLS